MLVLCVCTELSAGPAGESGRGNGIQAGVLGRKNGHHSAQGIHKKASETGAFTYALHW